MAVEIFLDVRNLEAPEPLQEVLRVLDGLREGCYLRVFHRRNPLCLCQLIDRLGFVHEIRRNDDSTFDIFVWHASDEVTALAVQRAARE